MIVRGDYWRRWGFLRRLFSLFFLPVAVFFDEGLDFSELESDGDGEDGDDDGV